MFQGITSRNIEITPSFPSTEILVSSCLKQDEISELMERLSEKKIPIIRLRGFVFSEVMKIDHLSSRYQHPEFKTETAFTEEVYKKAKQIQRLIRISGIIDKIMCEEEILREMDKHELLKTILEILNKFHIELDNISDEDLLERIKRVLILEAMSGILKELKPEDINVFDESVKRRKLFE